MKSIHIALSTITFAVLGANATIAAAAASEYTPGPEIAHFVAQKSLERVRAETREAARPNPIPRKDVDYALFAPTPVQLRQSAAEGLRARSVELASC